MRQAIECGEIYLWMVAAIFGFGISWALLGAWVGSWFQVWKRAGFCAGYFTRRAVDNLSIIWLIIWAVGTLEAIAGGIKCPPAEMIICPLLYVSLRLAWRALRYHAKLSAVRRGFDVLQGRAEFHHIPGRRICTYPDRHGISR